MAEGVMTEQQKQALLEALERQRGILLAAMTTCAAIEQTLRGQPNG